MQHLALYFNLAFFNVFVKYSPTAISPPNLLSMIKGFIMSKKPKPCKVKIYVSTYLKAIYQPATELKPFFGLPTLSYRVNKLLGGLLR